MKLSDYNLLHWKDFKVSKKKRVGSRKILLLSIDRTVSPPVEGRKNLLAVNKDDEILWIADLPTSLYDSYYEMEIKDGTIYAKSSNGLMAEIDPDTGTIIRTYLVY
jgi:hypothetical protein